MDIIKVKGLSIGEGRPKVCVPVTGHTPKEIDSRIKEAADSGADLAEWRADWYDGLFTDGGKDDALDTAALDLVLASLRDGLGDMPLLVTYRTAAEGGMGEISRTLYRDFLEKVISSGMADLVDVELFMGKELLSDICAAAHKAGVYVVASSHDFLATPPEEEIIQRLCTMQECGADLLKIAVMPASTRDVLTLLSATARMRDEYADKPLITMSMGSIGVVSRLTGEVFGSAVTFGSAGTASAPGQPKVEELRTVLGIIDGLSG